MFSFHKPKIYRSLHGCCICKAKSSSSRFTDSKKYEPEFDRCFRTPDKRSGDICNACVLLVKRWKKLPPGTKRDWRHVVDARAGPGTKTGKQVTRPLSDGSLVIVGSAHHHKKIKVKSSIGDGSSSGVEGGAGEGGGEGAGGADETESSEDEDIDYNLSDAEEDQVTDVEPTGSNGRKRKPRVLRPKETSGSDGSNKKRGSIGDLSEEEDDLCSFLDMTYWRKEKICCGIIFKGGKDEVMINPSLLTPCDCRKSLMKKCVPSSTGSTGDNVSITSSDSASSSSSSPPRIEDDTESNASSYSSAIVI